MDRRSLALSLLSPALLIAAMSSQEDFARSPAGGAARQADNSGAPRRDGNAQVLSVSLGTASLSDAANCARSVLKDQGWKVLAPQRDVARIRGVRHVSGDELPRVAERGAPSSEARLTDARADVTLNLTTGGGSSRMDVSVRILAYEDTSLPLLRLSNWLAVPSRGVLEKELGAALRSACARRP